jgi:uncharacterized membrane protein YhhN
MTPIVLCLFAGAALVHLVSLFFRNRPLTALTKVCLLPLLLALYLVTVERYAAAVILGGLGGWLGDALLLNHKRRVFFVLGLVSFLLGHLAYIRAIRSLVPALNLPALAVSAGAALALGIGVLKIIRPDRGFLVPAICYTLVLELMSLSALQLALYRRDPPSLGIFAGSLCFIVSDSFLAGFTFRGMPKYGSFLVMSFYITAQFCILGGLTLLRP